MSQKNTLRKNILSRRDALSEAYRQKSARTVASTLATLPESFGADTIAAFMSFGGELPLTSALTDFIEAGRRILLPKMHMPTRTMVFYAVEDFSTLVKNTYGILEPDPERHISFPEETISCVLTPGVAFDASGYRLGYGGGFYDRFFAKLSPAVPRIGIAFELQYVSRIPRGVHDLPVHILVTESAVHRF